MNDTFAQKFCIEIESQADDKASHKLSTARPIASAKNNIVGEDNCVSFEWVKSRIPEDRTRMRYVRVKVGVHGYPNRRSAIFRGPHPLVRHEADARLLGNRPAAHLRPRRGAVLGGDFVVVLRPQPPARPPA